MLDSEIRPILLTYLADINKGYEDTVIVNEFDICKGHSRVDIAVINGVIHGYEIKSDQDNLRRLPSQITYYNKSLEKISITINPAHFDDVFNKIPEWWGILVVKNDHTEVEEYRKATPNPIIETSSLLQLLWKSELLTLKEKYNVKIGNKSPNKKILVESLTNDLNIETIAQEVRLAIKSRKNWRN